jgi:hypothetical protein
MIYQDMKRPPAFLTYLIIHAEILKIRFDILLKKRIKLDLEMYNWNAS